MASKSELVLEALRSLLAGALSAGVVRNAVVPVEVPAAGMLILRDGEPGEPEVELSPLTYLYEHRAELEVFVLAGADADAAFDAVKTTIGAAIASDRTLAGTCDWCEAEAPQTDALAIDGAEPFKAGLIGVRLHYSTSDPLQ